MVHGFYEGNMTDRPTIGVHVRHGNGEESYRDRFQGRQIHDLSSFIHALVEKIDRYAVRRSWKNFKVFLCTDSDAVVEALGNHVTALASRGIWRPAVGQGVDFDHAYKRPDAGLGAAVDALVDMQLLAKCDAVFMTRPTTFASHVPYIMEKPDAVFLGSNQVVAI
jgi:hypothetical protein